jgi:hypothetical protein
LSRDRAGTALRKCGAEQIVAAAQIVAASMAALHGDEHLLPADKSRLKAFALN